jgi:hypothetical protein
LKEGGLGIATVNGKIYAIGGDNQAAVASQVISRGIVGYNEEYEPTTNTWKIRESMPTARAYFATAVYQNKIYCIGGKTANGTTGANEMYNPETNIWETKSPAPTNRAFAQAHVVDGKIYLIGGYPNGETNEVYDPEKDVWVTKEPMPISAERVFGYSGVCFNNKIYEIGHNIFTYDPQLDNWTLQMTDANVGGVAVATTGMLATKLIYIFSGSGTQIFDPSNNTLTIGMTNPTIRDHANAVTLNDKIYLIGGIIVQPTVSFSVVFNGKPIAVNEEYTPIGYGTIPPVVYIVSIEENGNYSYDSDITLDFSIDKAYSWAGYSLDGTTNITISGNTTITGLSGGRHNITIYAKDMFGNMAASKTVTFDIVKSEPQVDNLIVLALVSGIIIFAIIIYLYKARDEKNE